MIGRTYLEKGQPVVVLARWGDVRWRSDPLAPHLAEPGKPKAAPKDVRIRRADGSLAIRPFRGLRRP